MPTDDGLVFIDQNQAHQRIIYERALSLFENENSPSQHLLLPLSVDLDAIEMALVKRTQVYLQRLGFQVRDFGASAVIIDAVPPGLPESDHAELFRNLLGDLGEDSRSAGAQIREHIARVFAARTAIQTGQALQHEEIKTLMVELFKTNDPFRGPQGRPTMAKLSVADIKRLFGS